MPTTKQERRFKGRRFPIPPDQPHRDRKNDYRRKGKHKRREGGG